jgi:hypothetical protein
MNIPAVDRVMMAEPLPGLSTMNALVWMWATLVCASRPSSPIWEEGYGEVSIGPSLPLRTELTVGSGHDMHRVLGPVWDRGAVLRLGVQVAAAREFQHGRPDHPGVFVRLRILPLNRRLRHGMFARIVGRQLCVAAHARWGRSWEVQTEWLSGPFKWKTSSLSRGPSYYFCQYILFKAIRQVHGDYGSSLEKKRPVISRCIVCAVHRALEDEK